MTSQAGAAVAAGCCLSPARVVLSLPCRVDACQGVSQHVADGCLATKPADKEEEGGTRAGAGDARRHLSCWLLSNRTFYLLVAT